MFYPNDFSSIHDFDNQSIPILSPNTGEGILLLISGSENREWHLQRMIFEAGIVWRISVRFRLSERPQPNSILDSKKERQLILTYNNGDGSDQDVRESGGKDISWQWAQGYIGADRLYHIFTSEGVYIMEPPEDQNPMILTIGLPQQQQHNPQPQSMVMITLKAIKLSYWDYFICNENESDVRTWNKIYQTLIYMVRMPQGQLYEQNKSEYK